MFALQNTPLGRLVLAGLSQTNCRERISAQFDLVLDIWETSDGSLGPARTPPICSTSTSAHRGPFADAALIAAAAPARRSRLALLPRPSGWSSSMAQRHGHGLPARQHACGAISRKRRRGPERIAARARPRASDLRGARRAVQPFGRRLRALRVGRNDFVALLDERGLDFLTAMVGVLKTGAAFLPIDPVYPVERVRWMLSDSAVAILITRSTLMVKLDLVVAANTLRELVLLDDPAAGAAAAGHRIHARAEWLAEEDSPVAGVGAGADFAYMLYTSGSTGQPKGAIVRNNGAVNHIYGQFRRTSLSPRHGVPAERALIVGYFGMAVPGAAADRWPHGDRRLRNDVTPLGCTG